MAGAVHPRSLAGHQHLAGESTLVLSCGPMGPRADPGSSEPWAHSRAASRLHVREQVPHPARAPGPHLSLQPQQNKAENTPPQDGHTHCSVSENRALWRLTPGDPRGHGRILDARTHTAECTVHTDPPYRGDGW